MYQTVQHHVPEYRANFTSQTRIALAETLMRNRETPRNRYANHRGEERADIVIINNNSVALVRERTIPTERPSLVGEVSANFCG
jgi:hypothetical protein